jgi:hypothetical protein
MLRCLPFPSSLSEVPVRFSHYAPLAVIAGALLAGCTGDPAATTAPTTPSFSQTSTISPTHRYRLSLSCSNAAGESLMEVNWGSGSASGPCDFWVAPAGFTSFNYTISLREIAFADITVCAAAGVNTTGTFKCKIKKWSATLTVTDLGPVA